MKKEVYIAHTNDIPIEESPFDYSERSYEPISNLVQEVFKSLNLDYMIDRKTVLLKPNFVRINPKKPITVTDPRLVKAVALCCLRAGAKEVQVSDNPGFGLSAEKDVFANKIVQAIRYYQDKEVKDIVFTPWDIEDFKIIEVDGEVLNTLMVPNNFLEADIVINMPKMKTHIQAGVSLGLKNLQGVSYHPERYHFHRNDLTYRVIDILSVRQPDITIVDGILPMEGQAPFFGKAISGFNTLVAGQDVVAVDSVAAKVMGYRPEEVPMIMLAAAKGYGERDLDEIEIKGQSLDETLSNYGRPQTYFERAIMSSIGVIPNIKSVEGGTCTGCMSALRHSIDRLVEEKTELDSPFTVYSGVPMPENVSMRNIDGHLIAFGNCAASIEWDHSTRNSRGIFLPGCPPNIFKLYDHLKNAKQEDIDEDSIWEEYAESYNIVVPHSNVYNELMSKVATHVEGNNVLDVACGVGYLLKLLEKEERHLFGFDSSEEMIKHAEDKDIKNCQLRVLSVEGMGPVPEYANLDTITCINAIYHWAEPISALENMFRALREGGKLVLSSIKPDFNLAALAEATKTDLLAQPNSDKLLVHYERMININAKIAANGVINLYHDNEILELLTKVGFHNVIYHDNDSYLRNNFLVVVEK